MVTFFLLAFLMLVISLAILLRGLIKPANSGSNPVDVNVEIAKETKRALEHALATGEMTQESFDIELQQLESTLASNISAAPTTTSNTRGQWVAAGLMLVGIPLGAGLLYLKLGTPAAIDALAQIQEQQQEQQAIAQEGMPPLDELLPNLEAKLEENPDDLKGWKLLGRTYLMVGDFDKAAVAARRALELDGNDADLLSQLAESVAMQQRGGMQGEPLELVTKALAINPEHRHASWLSAIADQQQGEHKKAIAKFEALLPGAQDDPRAAQSITNMLAVSKQALSETTASNENTAQAQTAPAASGNAELTVTATLSTGLSHDLPDTSSVFIYARASSGPPMPLAVARLQLKDLPATVKLNDSMAMMPNMTLSSFADVIVGARISPSGNAIRQPGDFMGETDSINVSTQDATVNVIIDTQVE